MSGDAILRQVATAVALIEGEGGVRDVIGTVARLEPAAVRKISRASELPVPIVAAICAELRKHGVVAHERPVRLTPRGRELFGYRAASTPVEACPSCEGSGITLPNDLHAVAAELTEIADAAPRARLEIDQSHCTVPTKLRRVLMLHEAGALEGRRVLFLGDDDLMSVTVERVAQHYGFAGSIREMAVVDVDPAVLNFCRARLPDPPFSISFIDHDLRAPLPSELIGRFDTVFTDPPYTPEGAELFLSRAAAALSDRGGGSVFFCFGMKPPPVSLRVQAAIAGMGFVIRRIVRNFNEYAGAGALGGVSNLYHLTSTTQTRPLIDDSYTGLLYTGDERGTRRYLCKSCGAIEIVGRGQRWDTVGDLKTDGCPRCRGTSFRPLPRART